MLFLTPTLTLKACCPCQLSFSTIHLITFIYHFLTIFKTKRAELSNFAAVCGWFAFRLTKSNSGILIQDNQSSSISNKIKVLVRRIVPSSGSNFNYTIKIVESSYFTCFFFLCFFSQIRDTAWTILINPARAWFKRSAVHQWK